MHANVPSDSFFLFLSLIMLLTSEFVSNKNNTNTI